MGRMRPQAGIQCPQPHTCPPLSLPLDTSPLAGCYRIALFLQTDPLFTALDIRHSKRQDFLPFTNTKRTVSFPSQHLYKFAHLQNSVLSCGSSPRPSCASGHL